MRKSIAALMLAALALLTACGEGAGSSKTTALSTAGTSSGASSSAPAITPSSSENTSSTLPEDTSSMPPEDKERDKVPLTQGELYELQRTLKNAELLHILNDYLVNGREFDFLASPYSEEALRVVLADVMRQNVGIADNADSAQNKYDFSPETVEKLIKKNVLLSFDISRAEYPINENGFIEYSPFGGGSGLGLIIAESGYKLGDTLYINILRIDSGACDESMELSLLPEDYFDIPRRQLVIKGGYVAALKNIDERTELMETAEKMFAVFKAEQRENSENPERVPWNIGVMDGELGKRMYFFTYLTKMGMQGSRTETFRTFGPGGEKDVITYTTAISSTLAGYTTTETDDDYTINSESILVEDELNGDTYEYNKQTKSLPDPNAPLLQNTMTCKLNGSEITEEAFCSARSVAYFKDIDSGGYINTEDESRFIYKCEKSIDDITLADLYDIARAMT